MNAEITPLERLQTWYLKQCDGVWEHTYRVKIGTLDNPGWLVNIDLFRTTVETKGFTLIETKRTEQDWFHISRHDNTFNIACGPENLNEALAIFCDWAES